MRGRGLVAALAAGSVAWFALVVLAPHLPPALAAAVYAFGALVCHQRPERSFHWDGAQLAVCARCTGIYLGACVTAVLAFVPPRRYAPDGWPTRAAATWLAAAALPTAGDRRAEWAGWWQPSAHDARWHGSVLVVPRGSSWLLRSQRLNVPREDNGLDVQAAGLKRRLAAVHYNECLPRAADHARRQPVSSLSPPRGPCPEPGTCGSAATRRA